MVKVSKTKNNNKEKVMKVNIEIMNKVIEKCKEDGKKKPIISKELLNKMEGSK